MRVPRLLAIVVVVAFAPTARAADCNGNGVDDAVDVTPVTGRLLLADRINVGGPAHYAVVSADFDGDGDVDVVAHTSRGIALYRNEGGLERATTVVVSVTMTALLAADVHADGAPDLVTLSRRTNDLTVYRNRGDGTFEVDGSASIPEPLAAAAGDLDGDGDEDFAVAVFSGVVVVLRSGDDLEVGRTLEVGSRPVALVIADVDGDRDGDIVTANRLPGNPVGGDNVSVLLNDGEARFALARNFFAGFEPTRIVAADLDADGDLDLATSNRGEFGLTVLRNLGGGSFEPTRIRTPGSSTLAVADVDSDGALDLVSGAGLSVALNDGLGNFGEPREVRRLPKDEPLRFGSIAFGDFDDDGDVDAVAAAGSSGLVYAVNLPLAPSDDCDGDGVPDECQIVDAPLECSDCNLNDVPDVAELATGQASDIDRNGLLDECETAPDYILGFEAPTTAGADAGGRVEVPVVAMVHTRAETRRGIQGWFVLLSAEGCEILEPTTVGTAAEDAEINVTDLVVDSPGGCSAEAHSAIILGLGDSIELPPGESPHAMLRFVAAASVREGETRECELAFVSRCAEYEWAAPDGQTSLRVAGGERLPYLASARVRLEAGVPFHRGDVDADGRLTIADAVAVFLALLPGGADPPCLEAADTNDDGRLDLSDGVRILEFLFLGGPPPEFPGPPPGACGHDRAESGRFLGCAQYDPCR